MRCLKLILLTLLLLSVGIQTPVLRVEADGANVSYVTVTFTSLGFAITAPSGFTATVISSELVQLDWTNPDPANLTTVIVGKQGDEDPASPTDGYVVYTGDAATANDTSVNFENLFGDAHYKAYSYYNGSYSEPVSALAENINMSTLILAITEVALMITVLGVAYWRQDKILYIIGGFGWALFGFSYISGNPYLATASFGLTLVLAGGYTVIRGVFQRG